jgi:transposase InsO family protein
MNAAGRPSGPRFSPLGMWTQVPASTVRDQLRRAFVRWGLPGGFRVDNGSPWGSRGEWPTELALWVIGLGVTMTWNRPRRPQDNGVIERSQGTANRWCEPWACDSPDELQGRLERMDRLYREIYPYKDGRSRAGYYPELTHSGRPYAIESEARIWDWARIKAHLSGYAVVRQVGRRGCVSIYNRERYVGKIHRGKAVYVMFDPETNEWLFADTQGHYLCRKPADELSPESVLDLNVTRRE